MTGGGAAIYHPLSLHSTTLAMSSMTLPPHRDLSYILLAAASKQEELERLDEMHNGFQKYFENQLSFAPIGKPDRILELGAGGGAWTIQAAQMYPGAEVIAVDISPLPPMRPLPANVKFKQLDLSNELPFVPGTFEVVHMRLTLSHLQNPSNALRRFAELVKPGGWLLVEDMDHYIYSDESDDSFAVIETINSYFRSKGADPQIGHKLESMLLKMDLFNQVNATKVSCPFNPRVTPDPKLQAFGDMVKRSLLRAHFLIAETTSVLTKDAVLAFEKELNDPSRSDDFNTYFVSAQRS